jgi:hypothetical protein
MNIDAKAMGQQGLFRQLEEDKPINVAIQGLVNTHEDWGWEDSLHHTIEMTVKLLMIACMWKYLALPNPFKLLLDCFRPRMHQPLLNEETATSAHTL